MKLMDEIYSHNRDVALTSGPMVVARGAKLILEDRVNKATVPELSGNAVLFKKVFCVAMYNTHCKL